MGILSAATNINFFSVHTLFYILFILIFIASVSFIVTLTVRYFMKKKQGIRNR